MLGERRSHFQHVTDIVPTVLDYLGLEAPRMYRGLAQLPVNGRSMRSTIIDGASAPVERTQYFETDGHRAIWKDGWKAVAFHRRGTDFNEDRWELDHIDEDFSECRDLAGDMPDKLAELVAAWWVEAGRNQVLPLDDRGFAERANARSRPHSPRDRSRFVYFPGIDHIGTAAAPPVAGRSFAVDAHVVRESGTENGVLFAHGSVNSGYCLLIRDNHLVYDYNYYGDHRIVRSDDAVPAGESVVGVRFAIDGEGTGDVATLVIDDASVGSMRLPETFEHFVAFQGMDVGADRLSPVRQAADGAFEFEGGLRQVVVEILDERGGQPYAPCD